MTARMLFAATAAGLCLAAPAQAAGVKQATFRVSVKGVQTNTWKTDHVGTGSGCDGDVHGQGSETVRFASNTVKVRAIVTEGLSAPMLTAAGKYVDPTLRLRGKVTRKGDLVAAEGPCGGTGGGSIARDCGTRSFRGLGLTVGYQLGGDAKDDLDLRPEMIDDPFRNCPSGGEAFPVLVHSNEGARMKAELPRGELFDKRLGKIIVIARGKESVTSGEHTYVSRTRWEVTFRRLR